MLEKVRIYTKERFPLIPLFLYSLLTVTAIGTLFEKKPQFRIVLVLSFIYLGFWFHLRVLDEFKDYKFDLKYHPDRPIAKGIISLKEVKYADILTAALMIFLSFIITRNVIFVLFLISFGYTFLMFKEFFVENFSDRKTTLYIIAHEVVFLPLLLFFYSVFNGFLWLPLTISSTTHFLYVLAPITLIEIGRKIKHRTGIAGKKTSDTYAFRWGQEKTIYIFALLILIIGVISFFIENFSNLMSLVIVLFSSFVFAGGKYFRKIVARSSMGITTIISFALLIFLIASYYAK